MTQDGGYPAVEPGHLWGVDGLVELLRRSG
jgi:hypothetical protein